ncbi:MAG: YDG domain-containing protein, partial [Christensenella sp.]
MKKRIVSLLMAICMASTLMPIQSFAQEGDVAPLTTEASVNASAAQTPPTVGEETPPTTGETVPPTEQETAQPTVGEETFLATNAAPPTLGGETPPATNVAPQSPTPRAKETVTITGLERDNVRTYYNGKPHAGKLKGAVVKDNKVPVEELVCTYTGRDKNTIYGPSTTPPTNAGGYEMVVSVAESNPTYTGQSAAVYITIQKTGISLSSSTEVASKVYDGTTSATINKYAFSSLVKGEELILDTDFEITTPPVYSSADAGTADIHFTMALKDTPKAKNYELPYPDWGFAGESLAIKKKPLTKGTITPGREKPYDGNGDFTGLSATYEGGITGENVTGKVNGLKLTADAGSGALYVTKQTLDAAYAKNYAVPEDSAVTGNVEILKISPVITIDAPSTQKVGKDVTVTMTITNPAGATTGFPVMNDVSIVADANATAKGIVTQIGATGVYKQIFTIDATAVDGAIVKFTASVPKDITNYKANITGAEKTLTVSDKYTLTVTGGTGGGSYEDKAKVTITADAAPSGKVFDKWTTADGVVFKDANAAETTITMPKKDATVTATYKVAPVKTYTLTVTGGTGGGSYAEKANVTIKADAATSGKVFDKWTTADGVVFKD